ncbi:MAG: hypothetical protein Q9227_006663 [Pyrenula ochraceoflavens]
MGPLKTTKSKKRASTADSYDKHDPFVADDSDDRPTKKAKTSKASASNGSTLTDENGEPYWELSRTRRVAVSEFKGKQMVNIREYYESGGKTLPGKKGISLTMEQYIALVEALPGIEEVLKSKGEHVTRPEYGDGSSSSRRAQAEAEDDQEEEERQEDTGGTTKVKKERKKSNFEATSDEEEEEDNE